MLSIGALFAKSLGRHEAGELDDPILRAEMAAFDTEVFAYRAMGERLLDMWKTGRAHPASSNMMNFVGPEPTKRLTELVLAGRGRDTLDWGTQTTQRSRRGRPG